MKVLSVVFAVLACPALAHEWWIEPLDYTPAPNDTIEADLMNGQGFEGLKQVYLPKDISRFGVIVAGEETPVISRIGDRPALKEDALQEGLHVVAYQSVYATVKYHDPKLFEDFVAHKDLGADTLARHKARGLPEKGFVEAYRRFSKSLIGVGEGQGADTNLGLETELVALTNPYTDDPAQGFRVQLFYQGAPRANVQVEMFEKTPGKVVAVTLHRTDAEGIATVPVQRGSAYMLDAVVLREPLGDEAVATGAVWESLWANLTFSLPQ